MLGWSLRQLLTAWAYAAAVGFGCGSCIASVAGLDCSGFIVVRAVQASFG